MNAECHHSWPVSDYDLAATLNGGQAFRWMPRAEGWEGVIGSIWVRVTVQSLRLEADTALPQRDWTWLENYLQLKTRLDRITPAFPQDEFMRAAVAGCRGLRLLRQPAWECLASFLLSSNKRIAQFQPIIAQLCRRYGEPVTVPEGHPAAHAFPTPERLARCSESELRELKMGYRAGYLLGTARRVEAGEVVLPDLADRGFDGAREALMRLPGVGRKIAGCVLLFAYGFEEAFPIDTWVRKVLRQHYFPGQNPTDRELEAFSQVYFAPHSGYAQQYLFHHIRSAASG